MKKFSGIIKLVLLVSLLVVATFVFTGCAELDTSMDVSSGFKGTRVMDLHISNSDMSVYVEGGENALDASLEKSIPSSAISYKKTYSEAASEYTYSFTISFTSLEDYKNKVAILLAANPATNVTPEIQFEETKTDFKDGLIFSENFSSSDLLAWFETALTKDGVLSSSYALSTDANYTFTFDGRKIDTGRYSSSFNIDVMVYNTFSDIDIMTDVKYDGSFDRSITFTMEPETIENLKSNNSLIVSDYMANLVAELGDETVLLVESDGDYGTEYKISFTSENVEKLLEYTNIILKSENNTFEITVSDGPDGTANIALTETVDALHYINYRETEPSMSLAMYPGCRLADDQSENYMYFYGSSNLFRYSLDIDETLNANFVWDVMFADVELILTADSKIKGELELSIPEKTNEIFSKAIGNFMGSIQLDYAKIKNSTKDGNIVYTVDFGKGSNQEIEQKINNFIADYTNLVGYSAHSSADNTFSLGYYKVSGGIEIFSSEYSLNASFAQTVFTDNAFSLTVKTGFGSSFSGELYKGEKEVTTTDTGFIYLNVNIKTMSVFIIIGIMLVVILIPIAIFVLLFMQRKKKKQQMALAAPAGQYLNDAQNLYGHTDPMAMQPQIPQQAPAFEQQAPAFEQQAPAFEQQAPAYEQQAPAFEQQAPAFGQQAPAFEQQAPAFEQQAPAYEQQAPAFEQQAPAFEQQAPAYEQQAPAFGQQAPQAPAADTQIYIVPNENDYDPTPPIVADTAHPENITPPAAPQE